MNKPSRLFVIICAIMRCDPDLMAQSPKRDRIACVSEAALLGLVGLISAIAWTIFWTPYTPFPIACGFGLIAFGFIVLLDVAIGAADPQPEGILRPPGFRRRWDWWGRIALRIGLTVILSVATSEGATMAMFPEAIKERLAYMVQTHNRDAQDHLNQKVTAYRQQHFGALLDEIKKQQDLITQTTQPFDQAKELQATAQNHLDAAEREIARQRAGHDGYAPGCGPKCKAAIIDADAARADLAKAGAQLGIYKPRHDQANEQLKKAQSALDQAESASRDDIARLELEKQAEIVTMHNDPLLAYRALEMIYADPDQGDAARHFALVMKIVLITLELSYLMLRLIFAHASVYTMLLLADTRLRADAAQDDYRRRRAAFRTDEPSPPASRALPPIRLISWDPPPAKHSDANTPPPRDDNTDGDREAAD